VVAHDGGPDRRGLFLAASPDSVLVLNRVRRSVILLSSFKKVVVHRITKPEVFPDFQTICAESLQVDLTTAPVIHLRREDIAVRLVDSSSF